MAARQDGNTGAAVIEYLGNLNTRVDSFENLAKRVEDTLFHWDETKEAVKVGFTMLS